MEWRPIPDYPEYCANELGQVTTKCQARLLKQHPTTWGYLKVTLYSNGKGRQIDAHRVIASTFHGPANGRAVNHKDNNKQNNRADNLEWVTWKENSAHMRDQKRHTHGEQCHSAKVLETEAQLILDLKFIVKQWELAKLFGVSRGVIEDIHRGHTWAHLVRAA